MSPEINSVVFQKNWPSVSGFGGAERATMRFTETISQIEPIAVLTCGEYYRGKEKLINYHLPEYIFSKNRLTIHEIPSVSQIVDLVLKNHSEIGVFQIGWGFEHYPGDFARILETDLPIILRICEIDQYSQLVQELPEHTRRQFLNKIKDRVDALVAISNPLVQEAIDIGFDPKKVHLIHSSVDTDLFRPVDLTTRMEIRKELAVPADKKVFLFVGRMVQAKGIDMLLKAWNSSSAEFRNNNFLIIAGATNKDDAAFDTVQQAISSQDQSIKFGGVITDESKVAKYYQAADMFVYPSIHKEGLSVSILEAMSSGLPVITTEWAATKTGASDLIKIGWTGLAFDHRNGQKGLLELIENLDWIKLSGIGQEARKHILSLGVDNRTTALKYLNLYKELRTNRKS